MRLPKMSRKGMILRNLFVVALSLFCMVWYQGFPTRSYEALLQRAAGAYLIEKPPEVLYVYDDFVYGAVNGQLLCAGYEERTLGMQLVHSHLFSEGKQYVVHYDTLDYQRGMAPSPPFGLAVC